MRAFKDIPHSLKPSPQPSPAQPKDNPIDAEADANAERALIEKVNSTPQGQPCAACRGAKMLRADLPVGHKRFGMVRLCACHPNYALRGGEWFR